MAKGKWKLREAAGDFSANVQYDLAGPPVPDTNFAFLWLANVCHLGGGWKKEHCVTPKHLSKNT